ncbi:MAG: hypothetical protein QXL15_03465 [Candidatus Korarchaeota archaeon]
MDPSLVPLLINVMIGVVISDLVIVAFVTWRALTHRDVKFYLFWILIFGLFTIGDTLYLMFLLTGANDAFIPLTFRITSRTVLSFVTSLIYLSAFELAKLAKYKKIAWLSSITFLIVTAVWSYLTYELLPSRISISVAGIVGIVVFALYALVSKDKRYWILSIAYILEMVGGIIFALENPLWYGMAIAVGGNFLYMVGSDWITKDRKMSTSS